MDVTEAVEDTLTVDVSVGDDVGVVDAVDVGEEVGVVVELREAEDVVLTVVE